MSLEKKVREALEQFSRLPQAEKSRRILETLDAVEASAMPRGNDRPVWGAREAMSELQRIVRSTLTVHVPTPKSASGDWILPPEGASSGAGLISVRNDQMSQTPSNSSSEVAA